MKTAKDIFDSAADYGASIHWSSQLFPQSLNTSETVLVLSESALIKILEEHSQAIGRKCLDAASLSTESYARK